MLQRSLNKGHSEIKPGTGWIWNVGRLAETWRGEVETNKGWEPARGIQRSSQEQERKAATRSRECAWRVSFFEIETRGLI